MVHSTAWLTRWDPDLELVFFFSDVYGGFWMDVWMDFWMDVWMDVGWIFDGLIIGNCKLSTISATISMCSACAERSAVLCRRHQTSSLPWARHHHTMGHDPATGNGPDPVCTAKVKRRGGNVNNRSRQVLHFEYL